MGVSFILIFGIVILLLILCIALLIWYIINFNKYVKKYNAVWSKFENENIEKDIETLIQNMENTKKISEETNNMCDSIERKTEKALQKLGFVRYDAYEQGNNGLSFSIAVLDNGDNGILINSIYTRNGSNIYAKQIINGEYEGNLSLEEEKALQKAKNSKTFM